MSIQINREEIKSFLHQKVKEYNSDGTRKNRNIVSYHISIIFSELDKKLPKDSSERKQILQEFYQILPQDLKNHFKWTRSVLKEKGIIQ